MNQGYKEDGEPTEDPFNGNNIPIGTDDLGKNLALLN